jgi:hypothetical protein
MNTLVFFETYNSRVYFLRMITSYYVIFAE